MLAQAKFAYNDSPNKSTGMRPFQIMYGIHPRGVYELRNLGPMEMRSVDGEDFTSAIQDLHEQVKSKLEESTIKYKKRADVKRKEVNFDVRDSILAHLRKERFPRGECNKLIAKNLALVKFYESSLAMLMRYNS